MIAIEAVYPQSCLTKIYNKFVSRKSDDKTTAHKLHAQIEICIMLKQ